MSWLYEAVTSVLGGLVGGSMVVAAWALWFRLRDGEWPW